MRVCGGSVHSHLSSMFIGCSVHLDRDLIRRSMLEKVQERSGLSSKELLSLYKKFRDAETPESAMASLQKIKAFDEEWVQWVEGNGMASMISKSLSLMSSECRSLGFSDTNVVESQNRRGNVLVGTHNRPGEAALKLWDVDKLDVNRVQEGFYNNIAIPVGVRARNDSILKPSGGAKLAFGKRKRSKSRLGPTMNRNRRRKEAVSNDSDICNAGGADNLKPGAHDEDESIAGKGKQVRSEKTPAPAHIEDMRVSAETEEIRLSNRVDHRISELLEEVDHVPRGQGQLSLSGEDDLTESRTNTLIQLLGDVNDADRCIEKVKKALFKTMRLDSVRTDRHFRNAILSIFRVCMKPLPDRVPDDRGLQCGNVSSSSPNDATNRDGTD